VRDVRTFELLLWLFHVSMSTIWLCNVQDNAKPHVARVCSDFLQTPKADVLPWSAFSPNLNQQMSWIKFRYRPYPSTTIQDLEHVLLQEYFLSLPSTSLLTLWNDMFMQLMQTEDTRKIKTYCIAGIKLLPCLNREKLLFHYKFKIHQHETCLIFI
jgi:hypothetical protein